MVPLRISICFIVLQMVLSILALRLPLDRKLQLEKRHHNIHHHDEKELDYLELRAVPASASGSTETVITLQNHALMNTRLRVLYTDANGNPAIAESGRLMAGQKKSITLPASAQHVKILVEKDLFFENWRVAYEGTMADGNQCIRIVGVTFFSRIHRCK